jgi:hypothetical protein
VVYLGDILAMAWDGSVQVYDSGFNSLGSGWPKLPTPPGSNQGIALDPVNKILYAACQTKVFAMDLSTPTVAWQGVDLNVRWGLPAQVYPLSLAVDSQSGNVYVLYIADGAQNNQAHIGIVNLLQAGNDNPSINTSPFLSGGGLAASQGNVFVSVLTGGSTCVIEVLPAGQNAFVPLPGSPTNLQVVQALALTETAVTWQRVTFGD